MFFFKTSFLFIKSNNVNYIEKKIVFLFKNKRNFLIRLYILITKGGKLYVYKKGNEINKIISFYFLKKKRGNRIR